MTPRRVPDARVATAAPELCADPMCKRLGDHRRHWTLVAEGARPLTVNAVAKMHRFAWAAHTAQVRQEWGWLARAEKLPRLAAVTIDATPLHLDYRSPQDCAAMAPHVKACVDGLVDAGVIPNDSPDFVWAITFHRPRVCGTNGLELTIYEAAGAAR